METPGFICGGDPAALFQVGSRVREYISIREQASTKALLSPTRNCIQTCSGFWHIEETLMCRNIKTLFNFEPPATEEEIRLAALQFVRKVSGFNKPSKANEAAFLAAVDTITAAASTLLSSLETNTPPKNRAEEEALARARSAQRFSR